LDNTIDKCEILKYDSSERGVQMANELDRIEYQSLSKEDLKNIRKYLITKYDAMKVEPIMTMLLNGKMEDELLSVEDKKEISRIINPNYNSGEVYHVIFKDALDNTSDAKTLNEHLIAKQNQIIEELKKENERLKGLTLLTRIAEVKTISDDDINNLYFKYLENKSTELGEAFIVKKDGKIIIPKTYFQIN
jgi:hypothetical protein